MAGSTSNQREGNVQKWNHFSKVCHSKQKKSVLTVCENESENSTENEELFIDSIKRKGLNSKNTHFCSDASWPKPENCKF